MNGTLKDILRYASLATALMLALWILWGMVQNQNELLFNHADHTNKFIQDGNVLREQLKASMDRNTEAIIRLEKAIEKI